MTALARGFVQRGAADMMTRASRGRAESSTSPPEAFLRGSYVTALDRGFVQRGTVDVEMSDRAGLKVVVTE